jgi:uncharacterized damage-inducible protein DinB
MLNQALIPELKHEAASTRKMLERVPTDKWDWKPHDRSMTLGRLASHLATIPDYMTVTLTSDELDFAKGTYRPAAPTSTKTLLDVFNTSYEKALQTLEGASDETLHGMWSLKNGGHTIFTLPRMAALRSFVMNHLIHHRGQLSVYLRLLNIPVPGMYGPSADD